ncbi:MAG: hypothetical protein Q8O42_04670 [Acidobacteriota bacterium]|nr:hypothetical protein [Acidobacteriota bacterium]
MRKPVDVQFTYENLTSVAELSNESGAFVLRIIKRASNPSVITETKRVFGQAVEAEGRPAPVSLEFHKSRFDERLLRLSVLRAAYLVGVAVAGYSWIPIWDPVRQLIFDPTLRDEPLLQLVRYESEHSRDRRALAIIESPLDVRSFYIGFGRWTVFLPWERDSLLYHGEKLAGRRIRFTGTSYYWPTTPTFGIDWSTR